MDSVKLPVNLTWKLLARIFDDLSLESLCNDLFKRNECSPSNSYEIIYGLTLALLRDTYSLYESQSDGVTADVQLYDLDKTIRFNTLANSEVYGKTMKYNWFCKEHAIFVKVLQICEANSSKSFIKSLSDYKSEIETKFRVRFNDYRLEQKELYDFLKDQFDFDDFRFTKYSLMRRNEALYRNLCILAYLVLASDDINTSDRGSNLLDYSKLDCLLIQLYGVREIWRNINNIKQLHGKKHYRFDKEVASGVGGSLRPDAVYCFDNQPLQDILVDVKLYANPCIDGGVYKYRSNFNQVTTYALAYASFIGSKEADKSSRKDINYTDINAWILHFRKNITNREQGLNGKQLFDFSPVRVYNIDLSESKGIEYLDEQIKVFVSTYLLKEDDNLC